MNDPLSDIIAILKPYAPFSKLVHASSPFYIRRENVTDTMYCMLLSGSTCLQVDHREPINLMPGDFILIPALSTFSFTSSDPSPAVKLPNNPVLGADGIYRIGNLTTHSDVQIIVGHCRFESSDTDLLVSLLPDIALVQGESRLATITSLVRDELTSERPAKDYIVEHLLQILLIEAFRSTTTVTLHTGIQRGLADSRIGPTIRAIHNNPSQDWTVLALADIAKLSRSAFFARFNKVVGTAPMGYLLNWRMALAKDLLSTGCLNISDISEKVGYGSASAFSTAFTRHVGVSPSNYSMTNTRNQ